MRQSDFRGPPRPNKGDHDHIVNENITAPEVRLIGVDGEQHGVVKTRDALRIAEEAGLDLVEVAPEAKPPVCRLLDYGKLKYKEQKKAAEMRKKSSSHTTKELRLRYNTDKHDLDTKVRNARRFLEEGDRVKFEMRFKGREVVYESLGREIFTQILEKLQDICDIDERTHLMGTKMFLSLAPKTQK